MTYIVYMVECADGSYYVGITTDVTRRVSEHNGERAGGAKYTRGRRPVILRYTEEYTSRSLAQIREAELKKLSHAEKLKVWKEVITA